MRYSVRYPPAAATEVADAIRRYDQPDINRAASSLRNIEPAKTGLMSGSGRDGRVKGDIRRAELRDGFRHSARSGRTHAVPKVHLRAKLLKPFWSIA